MSVEENMVVIEGLVVSSKHTLRNLGTSVNVMGTIICQENGLVPVVEPEILLFFGFFS